MDVDGLQFILQEIGCVRIRHRQNNLTASCPFASYGGHSNADDKHPSFSIMINSTGESPWSCFTCGRKGTVRGLIYQVEEASGKDLQSLRKFIDQNQKKSLTSVVDNIGDYRRCAVKIPPKQGQSFLQHGWYEYTHPIKLNFDDFKKHITLHEYAKKRGITREQVEKWKIGFYKNRLLFVIFDENNEMVGYSGRAVYPDQHPKYLHCQGFKKERYLYGEQFFTKEYSTAFISEGFMDVLRLDRINLPNVAASMGTTLSLEQAAKIVRRFDEVIIFPHNDKPSKDGYLPPGLRGAQDSATLLKSKKPSITVIIAPMLDGLKDIGDANDEQLRWVLQKVQMQLQMWRESKK